MGRPPTEHRRSLKVAPSTQSPNALFMHISALKSLSLRHRYRRVERSSLTFPLLIADFNDGFLWNCPCNVPLHHVSECSLLGELDVVSVREPGEAVAAS